MGTSTRNKGQSGHTPLVPSWLDGEDGQSPLDTPVNQPCEQHSEQLPNNVDPNRFRGARGVFSRYITSGGGNRTAIARSFSQYVSRAVGGSANAVKRLGSARNSTVQLYGILRNLAANGGLQKVVQYLTVTNLAGLPAKQFFLKIAEFVCPDGGPNDEGLVRSAYFDAISDCSELENKTTEQLTPEECLLVLQNFMATVVMERILNDIANKIIVLPKEIWQISKIEDEMKQIIRQSVADAFARVHSTPMATTNNDVQAITDRVYQYAFDILNNLGE